MRFLKKVLAMTMLMLGIVNCRAFDNRIIISQNDGNVVELEMSDGMKGMYYDVVVDKEQKNTYVSYFLIFSGPIQNSPENNEYLPDVNPETGEEGKIWFTAPMVSMKEIVFDYDYTTGVDKQPAPNVSVSVNEGKITVMGVEKPVSVIVSRLSGQMVLQNIFSTDTVIDLTMFGNDVYVIKVGCATYKMLVRK